MSALPPSAPPDPAIPAENAEAPCQAEEKGAHVLHPGIRHSSLDFHESEIA